MKQVFILRTQLRAWQGNFEAKLQDPLHVRPIAHAIWDPHFGQPAVEAFIRGGASGPIPWDWFWALLAQLRWKAKKVQLENNDDEALLRHYYVVKIVIFPILFIGKITNSLLEQVRG